MAVPAGMDEDGAAVKLFAFKGCLADCQTFAVVGADDDSCKVGAEHPAGRNSTGTGIVDVAAIQRRMLHLDQHLTVSGIWLGDIGDDGELGR